MKITRKLRNSRGVALLIVLLVTTLLVALIFEFAYGTRVSVNAAMNYRDSQRAYYLARSGVGYVWWNLKNMPDSLPHNEWHVVPIISAGDTEVRVRWEDEKGKINISSIDKDEHDNDTENHDWLDLLFTNLGIDQNILNMMSDEPYGKFGLVSELHLIMNDKDYNLVRPYLTVHSDKLININTAPLEVLKSLGIQSENAEAMIERRISTPYVNQSDAEDTMGSAVYGKVSHALTTTTQDVRIFSYVTIGEYTKQIEAVIDQGTDGFTIKYWRAM